MRDSVKIIEHGFVVTGDKQNRSGILTLIIQGDRILEIGRRADAVKSQFPQAEVIDAAGKLICPGFIDSHYQGESFILRFFTSAQSFARWKKPSSIRKTIEYIRSQATYEELLAMYRLAYFSALKSGVTTISEFGMDYLDISLRASFEAMRQAELRGFIGIHNGDQYEMAHELKSSSIQFAAVAPGEEELTLYNLQSAVRTAREYRWPLILQLGETRQSYELLKKNFNKSVVQLCSEFKLFDYPLHLVNLDCFDEGDIDIFAQSKVPFIFTPVSIFQKRVDIPPIAEFQKRQIPVALGSDWGIVDPFENMRAYNHIQRILGLEKAGVSETMASHTINGACVLHKEHEIGSIETGKKADLVFVNAASLQYQSFTETERDDLLMNVMLEELTAQDVVDVMIGGEYYVREKTILAYSEEDLVREGKALVQKLLGLTARQVEKKSHDAEIIPFTPLGQSFTGDRDEIPFEEGYKIIRKNTRQENDVEEEPLQQKKDSKFELPKDVQRVFGDDEE